MTDPSLGSAPIAIPTDRTLFDPSAALARIRERTPLHRMRFPDGHAGWLATGYAVSRVILAHPRFSMQPDRPPVGDIVDSPAMIDNAVEELLRYVTLVLVGAFTRTAVEDVDINGTLIRKGESVIVSLAAAKPRPGPLPGSGCHRSAPEHRRTHGFRPWNTPAPRPAIGPCRNAGRPRKPDPAVPDTSPRRCRRAGSDARRRPWPLWNVPTPGELVGIDARTALTGVRRRRMET